MGQKSFANPTTIKSIGVYISTFVYLPLVSQIGFTTIRLRVAWEPHTTRKASVCVCVCVCVLSCWCSVGNEGKNLGVPLKETTSWMVFLGVIPFFIPCISRTDRKLLLRVNLKSKGGFSICTCSAECVSHFGYKWVCLFFGGTPCWVGLKGNQHFGTPFLFGGGGR